MEGAATEFIHSAAGFGPEWFLGLIVVAVVALFAFLFLRQYEKRTEQRFQLEKQQAEAQQKLEEKREERKQQEADDRIEHDHEMAEIKGQMVEAIRENNVLMAGMKTLMESVVASNESVVASNKALHEDFRRSQAGSQQMQSDMKDVKQKVDIIYAKEV